MSIKLESVEFRVLIPGTQKSVVGEIQLPPGTILPDEVPVRFEPGVLEALQDIAASKKSFGCSISGSVRDLESPDDPLR